MKNKLIPVLILAAFLFVGLNAALYASQDNFYGTWTSKYPEDEYTIIVKITISASNMTLEYEAYLEDVEVDAEKLTVDIIEWAEISNTDSDTRTAYPNGFIFVISIEEDETDEIQIFISRDKRQLTIPDLNVDHGDILVFRKQ